MRRQDKLKMIEKANLLAEQRHIQSNSLIREETNPIFKGVPDINQNDVQEFLSKLSDSQKSGLKILIYHWYKWNPDKENVVNDKLTPNNSTWKGETGTIDKKINIRIDYPFI